MDVQMILDAGARRLAQVDADVDALRPIRFVQGHLREARQLHQLHLFVGRQRLERGEVPCGHHHQMSVVIRIEIEDDVRVAAAKDDEVDIAARARVTENAVCWREPEQRSRKRVAMEPKGDPLIGGSWWVAGSW